MEKHSAEQHAEAWDKKDEGHNKLFFDGLAGETKEEYIQRNKKFSVFAYIDPNNGSWEEKSWSVKDVELNNKFNIDFRNMLESLPPETLITLVDCHT